MNQSQNKRKPRCNISLVALGGASLLYGVIRLTAPKRHIGWSGYADDTNASSLEILTPFILGLALLLIAWLRRYKWTEKYRICPTCEHVCEKWAVKDDLCPHDGTAMEPLEGFYDRYPERKKAPETFDRTND